VSSGVSIDIVTVNSLIDVNEKYSFTLNAGYLLVDKKG
jgi:hypothetical protein